MIIPLGVPIVHYLRTSVSLSLFLSPTPAISLKMVKKGFIHTYIHIYIYIYIERERERERSIRRVTHDYSHGHPYSPMLLDSCFIFFCLS